MLLVNIILVVQILSALAMAGLVLMQHGKGADMGAAFGSGSSGSLFGATGGANFLSRMTAVSATVFFASTLALGYLASEGLRQPASSGSVLDNPALVAPVPQSGSAGVSSIPGQTGQSGGGGTEAINAVPQSSTTVPESKTSGEQTIQPAQKEPSSEAASGQTSASEPAAGEAAASDAAPAASEQESAKEKEKN